MSRSGVTASIFITILIFMILIAYFAPQLVQQGTVFLVVTLIVLGLILAGILSAVVLRQTKAQAVQQPVPVQPEKPAAPHSAIDEKAVQILSVLQKKGRLIDFLQEDISGYQDSQVGAAVRNIHKGCREALAEYVVLSPVMKEAESAQVAVEKGFDPSAVRLTGNVVGEPPFRGTLTHGGWRAVKTSLPPLPRNQDAGIIEPAEVELG